MLTILLILISLDLARSLVITKQPSDKFALPGSSILFECQIDDYQADTDLIEWCKNDFCTWGRAMMDTVYSNSKYSSFATSQHRLRYKSLPRYFVLTDGAATTTKSHANVTWNLLIENATESDIGNYKCKVTRRNENFVLKVESSVANLTIMDKPKSVQLSRQGPLELVLGGKAQEVSCVVDGGVPAPDIYWILVDSSLINKFRLMKLLGLNRKADIEPQEEELPPFKSFHIINKTDNFRVNTTVISNSVVGYRRSQLTYMSTILLNGTTDLIGKTLVCAVEHQLFSEPMIKSIRIDLKYSPILSINSEPGDEPLAENKTFRFRCKSSSYPELFPNASFMSLINQKGQVLYNVSIGDEESSYLEIKLNRSMNGYVIRCQKENEIGRVVLNHKLNVLYAPRFTETPDEIIILNTTTSVGNKTVNKQKEMRLKCKADSNPEAIIFWFRNGNELVHIGESLQLKSVDRLDGQYSCQAKSAGFEPITTRTSLISTGPPTLIGNEFSYSSRTNEIIIQFTALSNPPFKFGPICTRISQNVSVEIVVPIKDETKYSLEVDNWAELNMSIRYIFKIRNPTKHDNGNYNCTIQNQLGSSHYNFEIRRREDNNGSFLTALSFTIFFIALISVLVLLIFTLFCVYKKRQSDVLGPKKKKLPKVSDLSSNCVSQMYQNSQGAKSLIVNDLIMNGQPKLCSDGSKMNDIIVKSILPINNTFDHVSSSPNNILNCNSLLSKQLNQISLIEQNLESNSFSFESIPNSSDTQNLIFMDNSNKSSTVAHPIQRQIHLQPQFSILPPSLIPTQSTTALLDRPDSSTSSSRIYQPAMIYSSRFQTNV